jgi:transcriptional antiterminator RfaH
MRRWFVASTRPHQEAKAAENLRRQSYGVWLPRLRRTRRHAHRFDTVLAPMFPGYLFVSFDPAAEPWRAINGTLGVRQLVCGAAGPTPLPDTFVTELRQRSQGDVLCDTTALPEIGTKVRVISGPFVDCIGTLVRADGANRVRLLLSLLGGDIDTALSSAAIAPL